MLVAVDTVPLIVPTKYVAVTTPETVTPEPIKVATLRLA